jgi:hypothetical protein
MGESLAEIDVLRRAEQAEPKLSADNSIQAIH